MSWGIDVSPEFEANYRKLCARNASTRHRVDRKMAPVLANPLHYKPIRAPLQGLRRVHVGGSVVMLFEADSRRRGVRFLRLAHHDEAYGY